MKEKLLKAQQEQDTKILKKRQSKIDSATKKTYQKKMVKHISAFFVMTISVNVNLNAFLICLVIYFITLFIPLMLINVRRSRNINGAHVKEGAFVLSDNWSAPVVLPTLITACLFVADAALVKVGAPFFGLLSAMYIFRLAKK
ncbi:hypothetical protein HGP28_18355 [Vibrio sp. SM6]|uniref:Uncharacterized protein n=1 Tax=Vibrio agarilyticus TaxID=2726741 RepID=A0A7X8TU31_9VIBR|nr:hypothetical protein [Vibrio agarilyticus]NLS14824.1 hypothetical protein [Vibrio agarilyticus]